MTTTPATRSAQGVTLRLDEIEIPETARPYSAATVLDLARSISAIGLQCAPTVIERDGRRVLVAGRHRIEALRTLGIETVLCRCVDFDDIEARMWTISENLFRAELTVAQRAGQIAEYTKLVEDKREAERLSAQVAQKAPHRPEGGDSLAARDLGLTRDEVRRAKTIAALPDETKQAARDLGYDDNQSALLKAARASTPAAQVAVLHEIAERGRVADDLSSAAPDHEDYDSRDTGEGEPESPVVALRDRPTVGVKPLRNLVDISGGEFARWLKITTPNDRLHVIRVLETAAAILRDELETLGAA